MKTKKFLTFALALIMFTSLFQFNIAAEGANVTFEAFDGTSNTNDGYANLIDGNVKTPWGSEWGGNYGTNAWIVIRASEEVVADGYTLVTAKDSKSYKNRNPKNWTFSGCNDYDPEKKTGSWKTIHTVTNDTVLQDKNNVAYPYSFENNTAYRYYKLEITANKGSNYMQLGEMMLAYTVPQAIRFSALDGTKGFNNENYENLFDTRKTNGNHTKWCVSGEPPYFVVAKADTPVIVSEYIFNTANDTVSTPGRNPKSWTLYGCNDYNEQNKTGGSWTVIDSIENDTSIPSASYASQSFGCADNIKSYQYYKLEITAARDGNTMQLAELEFTYTVCEHEWGEPTCIEATCLEPEYTIGVCTKCAYHKKEQTAPANGHTYDEDGICNVCQKVTSAKIENHFYESLQDAVDAANEGDTITLLRNFSTDSTLSISKNNLTLNLNGFTVTKTGNGSVIVISNGSTFTLTDLSEEKTGTVTGGSAANGGGVYVGENCTFNMSGCKISNCTAQNKGGAVAAYSGSTVNICENSEITENVSLGDGGAIYAENSAVNVNGYSVIRNNRAEKYSGGAIYAENSSNVTIGYCVISENTAKGNGGGVYALNSAVTMENGSVNSNTAVFGGGIYIHSSELVMNDGEIWDNKASRFGGGVMVQIGSGASSATINGGSISNNIAENDTNGGGGFWVNGSSIYSATLTVNGGQISNNICPVRTVFFTRNNRTLDGHVHKIGYEYRIVI